MKTKGMTKAAAILLAMLMFALTFTACGSKEIKLNVIDKGAQTEVDAAVGMTVEEVLKKAEITVGEKDETEPKLDEKITEDSKEINVKRYAKVVVKLDKDSKTVELVGGKVSDAIAKSGFKTDGFTLEDFDRMKREADNVRTELFLDICRACGQLSNGTCMGCGCLVEIRAASRGERCPFRKR